VSLIEAMEKIGLLFGSIFTSPKLAQASLRSSDAGVMPCGVTIEAPGVRLLHKMIELDEVVADDAWIRCEAPKIGLHERLLDKPDKFRLKIKKGNPDPEALSNPDNRSFPLFPLFGS